VVDDGMVPAIREADKTTHDLLELAAQQTPLKRLALAAKIAEATVFPASSKASYITGQRLIVDGGLAT
jgi:NAD(P)-dependent dehydrogenase (short-subunit alcohol dehydrogenase family)